MTIDGGKGNDHISLRSYADNNLIKYSSGDGKDTIFGINSTSTLQIGGGEGTYSTQISGNDVIVTVGKGSILLKNVFASADKININKDSIELDRIAISLTTDDNYIEISRDSIPVVGSAGNDSIDNYGASVSIDGGAGEDDIDNYSSIVTIDGGSGNDSIYNNGWNVTIDGGAGDDSIHNRGYEVTINGGTGNDSIYNDGGNVTIDGGAGDDSIYNWDGENVLFKYKAGDGNDTIWGFRADSTLQIGSGKGTYSTQTSGNDLIVNVGKGSILLKGVHSTLDNININNKAIELDKIVKLTADDNYIEISRDSISVVGSAGDDYINNHYGFSVSIDGGDGADTIENYGKEIWNEETEKYEILDSNVTISGGAGNDSIQNSGNSVTINGGAGNDTICNGGYIDGDGTFYQEGDYGKNVVFKYSSGDGKDKIYGFRADSTLQIAASSYSTKKSGDNVIVTVGKGKISLMGAASLDKINILKGVTYTDSSEANITLGADITFADATSRTKAIKIVGNSLANSIFGGAGNDTLNGGAGNDTLSGGNGDDLFVYTAGNDVITDYTEDSDKISISAAISKTSINGADATFTIGKNTLTVKDGFGKEIVFVDADGKERTIIGGAYLATNDSSSKSTLSSWREVGDASERTKAIKLTGNALDNSILGGSGKDSLYGDDGDDYLFGGAGADKLYGQNGNDTLWGGIGNDTLKGGDGADVFIYESGDGKDVINGFENNDMLLITDAFSASYDATKKAIAFKVDSTASAITIKDFTATKFNINGINYKISGSKLVKK